MDGAPAPIKTDGREDVQRTIVVLLGCQARSTGWTGWLMGWTARICVRPRDIEKMKEYLLDDLMSVLSRKVVPQRSVDFGGESLEN